MKSKNQDLQEHISTVRSCVEELRKIKDVLYEIQDSVDGIEKCVSEIDSSLPDDNAIAAMPDGTDKAQLRHLLDLIDEAYSMVDEILGPPEDELTGQPRGTAFSPEARGTSGTAISLEDVLRELRKDNTKAAS